MLDLSPPPIMTQIVGCLLFLAVGLLGTIWAEEVRSYELKFYAAFNPLAAVSLLQEYVGSDTYLWQVRIAGVVCLIAAGALLYPLIR